MIDVDINIKRGRKPVTTMRGVVAAGAALLSAPALSGNVLAGTITCSGAGNAFSRNDIERAVIAPAGAYVVLKAWVEKAASNPQDRFPEVIVLVTPSIGCILEGMPTEVEK